MSTDNTIRKLQRQAASCTDELLEITADIGKYIVDAYGTAPTELFDMQCRIQLERCRRLACRLRTVLEALVRTETPESGEHAAGTAVTLEMIKQNLLILKQKEAFLTEFLAHSGSVSAQLKASAELDDAAGVIRLANTLRGELDQCRKENKKSN